MDATRNSETSQRTPLDAALDFARRGVPVFPIETGGKRPLTRRGHKDASANPETVAKWWGQCPTANVGIPTGSRSGLLVVDEDRDGAIEELERKLGRLPRTTTVRTGSGGTHLCFRYPDEEVRNSAGKLAEDVDVRGEGGYIVAPPSRTTSPYEVVDAAPLADLPAAWLAALRRPEPRPTRTRQPVDRGTPYPAPAPASTSSTETIPKGRRNDGLFRVACGHRARGFDEAAILAELERVNAERCAPPIDDRQELVRIARNVAARYEAGTIPTGPDTAALDALRAIEAAMMEDEYRGIAGKSRRDVRVALIKAARQSGTGVPGGVKVSMAIRPLALASGLSKRSTAKALACLQELGQVIRDEESVKERGKAGAFILPDPRAKVAHLSTREPRDESGLPPPAPLTAPRLRWSAPYNPRPGKTAGAVVDHLEAAGGELAVSELAEMLHVSRVRDFRARNIERLIVAGVVELSGEVVRLTGEWLDNLNREREIRGEIHAYRRDMHRYEVESQTYRVRLLSKDGHAPEVVAARMGLPVEQVRQILRPADPTPKPPPKIRDVSDLVEEPPRSFVAVGSPSSRPPRTIPEKELIAALNRYLYLHPNRKDETPSWLSNALWGDGRTPVKVPPHEVAEVLPRVEWWAAS